MRATVAAAITSLNRCRPISLIEVSGTNGVFNEKNTLCRTARTRERERLRIVGIDHRPVVFASDSANIFALAAPYSSIEPWRSRWSDETFNSTAIQGWNVSVVSS